MRLPLALLALLCAALLGAAIPESWFADKAALGPATRAAIYHALPTRHRPVGALPETLAPAFRTPPADRTLYVGEAYFVDHCLNHHPDVPDAIYRRLDAILANPKEIILDRRDGKDALILTQTIDGKTYCLVIRHYPPQLVYKTLFPADDDPPYPALKRWRPPPPKPEPPPKTPPAEKPGFFVHGEA